MSEQLKKMTEHQCSNAPAKYADLKALFLNCTLNRTPVLSHTEGLIGVAQKIFEANGTSTKVIRPVDYEIPAGLGLDMSLTPEWEKDDWPKIQKEIDACDILIVCTSVWLGEKSSVCIRTLERMYGYTHLFNEKGQYRDYGKVGATLITGNEDGVKHCAMNILFFLVPYRIYRTAPSGCRLDGRGRTGTILSGRRLRWPRERFYEQKHHFSGMELPAFGTYVKRQWRDTRARKSA